MPKTSYRRSAAPLVTCRRRRKYRFVARRLAREVAVASAVRMLFCSSMVPISTSQIPKSCRPVSGPVTVKHSNTGMAKTGQSRRCAADSRPKPSSLTGHSRAGITTRSRNKPGIAVLISAQKAIAARCNVRSLLGWLLPLAGRRRFLSRWSRRGGGESRAVSPAWQLGQSMSRGEVLHDAGTATMVPADSTCRAGTATRRGRQPSPELLPRIARPFQ